MTMKGRALCLLFFLLTGMYLYPQTPESINIFEKTKEGILSLYVYGANKELIGKGVGFGLSEDIIASSYHLVSVADSVEGVNVKAKKMKIEGIIAVDRNLDIALLKVKGKVLAIPEGNSDELKPGARIFSLGANESGEIVISEGTLRNIFNPSAGEFIFDLSLSVPEGFNGGPLLDLNGQVVGLMLILEKTGRVGVPANAWKDLSKAAKATAFKDWTKEDYFASLEGSLLAGKVFSLMDELNNAQKYLERAVKINPSQAVAQGLLASIYSKQRNYSAAVSAYNKLIELDPSRAQSYLELGNIYFRMQRWSEAITSLEKAIAQNIDDKEAYFTVGNAHEELRDFAKAADAYEKFLDKKPESAWTGFLRLGLCRMELGQFDLAVAAFESALGEQPQDLKVNFSLAQAYKKAAQLEKADAAFRKLVDLNPPDATTYFSEIVKMYDEAGRNEDAIEAAKKVVELNPKSEIAVYNLGIMYYKLKRYAEAIETFNQTLQVKMDYAPAYYNIGLCYSFLKKYKESIEAFKNYIALVPDNADAWINIGVGYMQLKDFESALEPLKKCVELRPDYGAALYNLAITYINLKDNYSARDVYRTLVTVDPDLAEKLKKFLR